LKGDGRICVECRQRRLVAARIMAAPFATEKSLLVFLFRDDQWRHSWRKA
jgi:hypothetical protein